MHLGHLFKQYLEYILYFLGVGFISGSLVHYTTDPSYYTIIIAVGIVIFTTTSIFQARDDEKRKVNIVKVTFTSLALSLGIGLLSGGIQHFKDVPTLAPLFIVLGIAISLIAYIFRENIQLSSKQVLRLSASVGLVGVVSYLLLVQISLPYIGQRADEHHSQTSNQLTIDTPNGNTSRTHSMNVSTDKEFIEMMIPHHEEAVKTSEKLLVALPEPKLPDEQAFETFLRNVITAQSKEVVEMKQWYKDWYQVDYVYKGMYQPMMRDTDFMSFEDAKNTYIVDMIQHHQGAIDMAQQITDVTTRSEIKNLATNITSVQTSEIEYLRSLLNKSDSHTSIDNKQHQ